MRRTRRTYLIVILMLLILVAALVLGYLYLTRGRSSTEEGGPLGGLTGPVPPTTVPLVRVLVAKQAVPARTVLTPELIDQSFEAREIERTAEIGDNVIGAESQLVNKITLVDLRPGDLLYASQFADATLSDRIPKGKRAMPLKVDRFSGVVGRAVSGDYVDVVFSGQVELHFPQAFPPPTEGPVGNLSPVSLLAVKTILQDIQLLEVIPLTTSAGVEQPSPTPSGEQPAAPPPPTDWIFILAVDDQQAEILRFAQDQGMTYQLLLRSRDDHTPANTQGATSNILVETYGLPKPQMLSYDIRPGQLPSGIVP